MRTNVDIPAKQLTALRTLAALVDAAVAALSLALGARVLTRDAGFCALPGGIPGEVRAGACRHVLGAPRVRTASAARTTAQPRKIQLQSRRDALKLFDREAHALLGVSRQAALRMLDRGQLAGTFAEAQLRLLRLLAT